MTLAKDPVDEKNVSLEVHSVNNKLLADLS